MIPERERNDDPGEMGTRVAGAETSKQESHCTNEEKGPQREAETVPPERAAQQTRGWPCVDVVVRR